MLLLMRKLLLVCIAGALWSQAKTVDITVLATSDLHGNLLPYDYFTSQEAGRGLATLGSVIRHERQNNPKLLLIDCGDTIQGSPLEGYYQDHFLRGDLAAPLRAGDPMMLAMNSLGYDAMIVGNHDFNYGLRSLSAARSLATFPWLSANTVADPKSGVKPFLPYIVKTIDGVKVAIVGITTPAIPSWEKAENYAGYHFEPGAEALRRTLTQLQTTEKPDVVIVGSHSGIDRDLKTGAPRQGDLPGENVAYQLAQIPGVDVVVFGHTHNEVPEAFVGGTLLVQPKNWGGSLAEIHIIVNDDGGPWRVASKHSTVIPQNPHLDVDPEVARIAQPYHEATEAFLNTPVTTSDTAIDASLSTVQDTAILDGIQEVQLTAAKADVSFASPLNLRAAIPKGPVTVRQIAGLYVYDNELYAVEATGKMVREALENAARYYNSCTGSSCSTGPLLSGAVYTFNFDTAAGVSYGIDLSKPVGERIVNLTWHGKPLRDDQILRVAINNYRAGGSGGYTMWPKAKLLWRSYDTVRDLMIRYYAAGHKIPAAPDDNWDIRPEQAHRELQKEIQKVVQGSGSQ